MSKPTTEKGGGEDFIYRFGNLSQTPYHAIEMIDNMEISELGPLIAAILGPMAVIIVGFALLLNCQFRGSERRLTEQIKGVEQRLTEQYRETNRDTKTLIREVSFLQGHLGIPPRGRESDTDATAEAAN